MKRSILILGALVMMLTAMATRAQVSCSDPVSTLSGSLRGMTEENGTCAWKGIPFAAAPVGELRWKAPQPEPAWPGVRDAHEFGHRCMQKGLTALENIQGKAGMSEDCLYLNVWRPKKSGTFPVMVWIHGGGYTGGSAITPMYWGDRLAQEGDVVVVSFNYRLNVFGFMADPSLRAEDPNKSAGGYGTLDQVAGLQWVHDNIKNFGGDPSNVTIFGESAGGWSICTMIATPRANGLFQKAILESGGCTASEDLEKGYAVSKQIAEKLGCPASDLKCLRAVPPKQVMDAAPNQMGGAGNKPHHDGYVLTGTPLDMIRAGNFNRSAFMAGSNLDEFAKAMKLQKDIKHTRPSDYEKTLVTRFKLTEAEAQELAKLYPLSDFDNRPIEAYGRMFGADAALACPTYEGLLSAARQEADTYYYRFDFSKMRFGKYFGAAHSFEIPFIFDSLDRMPMNLFYPQKKIGPAKDLSKIIQGYWLNFARLGNPNGQGLPEWPKFSPANQQVQVLDSQVRTEKSTISDRCAFFETHKMDRHPEKK